MREDNYALHWKFRCKSPVAAKLSKDGRYAVTAASDGSFYFLDENGNVLWRKSIDGVSDIRISLNPIKILVGTKKGNLHLFDVDGRTIWERQIGNIRAVAMSSDSKFIAVGTETGVIYALDENGMELWKARIKSFVEGLAVTEKEKKLVVGAWSTIYTYDWGGNLIWDFDVKSRICGVDISEDGTFIGVGSRSKIVILDQKGSILREIKAGEPCSSIAVSKDGTFFTCIGNKIKMFKQSGTTTEIDLKEKIIRVDVCSCGDFILTNLEDKIEMFIQLKPKIDIMTQNLYSNISQGIEVAIENTSTKSIQLNLKIKSEDLQIKDEFKPISLSSLERKKIIFEVIPKKIGELTVFVSDDKFDISLSKQILVKPQEVVLEVILSPKNKFNTSIEPTTFVLKISNNGRICAKNIRFSGEEKVIVSTLKPGEWIPPYEFSEMLAEGRQKIHRKILCEDEHKNIYEFKAECEVEISKANFTFAISRPFDFFNGKEGKLTFIFRNVSGRILEIEMKLISDHLDIKDDYLKCRLDVNATEKIEFDIIPKRSGKIPILLKIFDNQNEYNWSDKIDVKLKPPTLSTIRNLAKRDYLKHEKILEIIEVKNIGEKDAVNIRCIGSGSLVKSISPPLCPRLKPREVTEFHILYKSEEIGYKRLGNPKFEWQDTDGNNYTALAEDLPDDPGIIVYQPYISIDTAFDALTHKFLEGKREKLIFAIKNIHMKRIDEIKCILQFKDGNVEIISDAQKTIAALEPQESATIEFEFESKNYGEIGYNLIVTFEDFNIEKEGAIIISRRKPSLDYILDDSKMFVGKFSELILNIKNVGEAAARKISIKLESDLKDDRIDNLERCIEQIDVGQEFKIPFHLKPNKVGDAKINIRISYSDESFKEMQEINEPINIKIVESEKLEIKRGISYIGGKIKFCVKVKNLMSYKLHDVKVSIRYPDALQCDEESKKIKSINPNTEDSVSFMLKPLRCIEGWIQGVVEYEDPETGIIKTMTIRPKEFVQICPMVEPLDSVISESQYYSNIEKINNAETRTSLGYAFKNINFNILKEIVKEKCSSNLSFVSDFSEKFGKDRVLMLNYCGKSKVRKIDYYLTIVLIEQKTHNSIIFFAWSSSPEGLGGFVSEIIECIRIPLKFISEAIEVVIQRPEVETYMNIVNSLIVDSKIQQILNDAIEGYEPIGMTTSKIDVTGSMVIDSTLNRNITNSYDSIKKRENDTAIIDSIIIGSKVGKKIDQDIVIGDRKISDEIKASEMGTFERMKITTLKCPKCGYQSEAGSNFCDNCSHPLRDAEEKIEMKKQELVIQKEEPLQKLRFLNEYERIFESVYIAHGGRISPDVRAILDTQRTRLGLSKQVQIEIEEKVQRSLKVGHEFYKDAFRQSLVDGKITDEERKTLETLAMTHHLSIEEQKEIEEEVLKEIKMKELKKKVD